MPSNVRRGVVDIPTRLRLNLHYKKKKTHTHTKYSIFKRRFVDMSMNSRRNVADYAERALKCLNCLECRRKLIEKNGVECRFNSLKCVDIAKMS